MNLRTLGGLACLSGLAGCGGTPAPRKAVAAARACNKPPTVLQVAWQPPRQGEKLRYEATTVYDFTARDMVEKGQVHFVTDEVVTSIDRDEIEELAVTFVEGRYQPDLAKPLVELSGTYRVRAGSDRKSVFTQDDQPPPPDDVATALRGYERGDVGQPNWLLRLLTDRTFELGREIVLPHQSVDGREGAKVDVKLRLKTISADAATFFVESHRWIRNRRVFVTQMDVVMDIVHARLRSIDAVFKLDLAPELQAKAGVSGHVDSREAFQYDFSTSSSNAPHLDGCGAPTLQIDSGESHVGDTYGVDEEVSVDTTVANEQTGQALHIRGGWTASTDDRITSVEKGVDTGIEIRVRKERVRDISVEGSESPETTHDGEVITLTSSAAKVVVARDGSEVQLSHDLPLSVALDGVMTKTWTTRLVTGRTFQMGTEQYFSNELIDLFEHSPSSVRIVLASMQGDVATFKLAIKSIYDRGPKPFPVLLRGELTFDVKKVRPIGLHLEGEFEVRGKFTKDGTFVMNDRFRY